MRVAISGSRTITDKAIVIKAIQDSKINITSIISGDADGVDAIVAEYASENGIEHTIVKPDWKKHGRAAGIIANKQILDSAEECIAVHDGVSKGTADFISKCNKKGLLVHIWRVSPTAL